MSTSSTMERVLAVMLVAAGILIVLLSIEIVKQAREELGAVKALVEAAQALYKEGWEVDFDWEPLQAALARITGGGK